MPKNRKRNIYTSTFLQSFLCTDSFFAIFSSCCQIPQMSVRDWISLAFSIHFVRILLLNSIFFVHYLTLHSVQLAMTFQARCQPSSLTICVNNTIYHIIGTPIIIGDLFGNELITVMADPTNLEAIGDSGFS